MAERSTTPERKCKRAKASDRIGQLTDFQSTTRSAAKNDRCRLGTVETNRSEEANKFTCMQMSRPPPTPLPPPVNTSTGFSGRNDGNFLSLKWNRNGMICC